MAAKSPVALRAAKALVNRVLEGGHEANLAEEARAFAELFATADAREGLDGVRREARAARFTGR